MKLKGVCTFHSETGTEGGHWAFQDEKFMNLPAPDHQVCTNCGRVWMRDTHPEPPKPSFTYLRERTPEHDYVSYMGYDEFHPELSPGEPGSFDEAFNHESNMTALACQQNGHLGWRPMYPNGMWSYEGLHVLHEGDKLTVYSKDEPGKVMWSGEVKLQYHDAFTQDVGGLWIHSDQEGMDRELWGLFFLQEYPAELETRDEPPAPPSHPRHKRTGPSRPAAGGDG